MTLKHISIAITVLGFIALGRLWSADDSRLWWLLLVIMVMKGLAGMTASTSVSIESKPFVVRFWRNAQIFLNSVCFAVSAAGLMLSFR